MRSIKSRHGKEFGSIRFYIFIVLSTVILSLYVSEQVYIFALEKKVYELQKQYAELTSEMNNLKIKAAELRSGMRIKQIAREDLGMNMPEGAPVRLF